MILALCYAVLLMFMTPPAQSPNISITLKVSPNVCFEPCTITSRIRVISVREGDAVCVGMDNGSFLTSSCWPHSGRTVSEVRIKNIPEGEYEVVAWLSEADNKRATANLRVLGEGASNVMP